jgi:hypothetical protein
MRPLSLLFTAAVVALLPPRVEAQVGHAPGASPYRDIPPGHSISAQYGWLGGSGGSLHLGPHSGSVYGVRYDVRTNQFLQLGLDVGRGDLDRLIQNPFVRLVDRVQGPVSQSVSFAEAAIQLNLSGSKSWHRLAPFFGVGFGVAFGGKGPAADTSGYRFKNKFYFAPTLGTRLFLTDRLHLRLEARSAFWKLSYPTSFTQQPPLEPGNSTKSNAVITNNQLSEWTATPWLRIGLAYSFTP